MSIQRSCPDIDALQSKLTTIKQHPEEFDFYYKSIYNHLENIRQINKQLRTKLKEYEGRGKQ